MRRKNDKSFKEGPEMRGPWNRMGVFAQLNPDAFGHCVIFSGKKVTAPQVRRCPYVYDGTSVKSIHSS